MHINLCILNTQKQCVVLSLPYWSIMDTSIPEIETFLIIWDLIGIITRPIFFSEWIHIRQNFWVQPKITNFYDLFAVLLKIEYTVQVYKGNF